MTTADLIGLGGLAFYAWAALTSALGGLSYAEAVRRYNPTMVAAASVIAVACQYSGSHIPAGIWTGLALWRAWEWWKNRPPRPPRRRRSLATATP